MKNFDVDGRAAAMRYQLASLWLQLRKQVLTREQARPTDPLLVGKLATLPVEVAEAAVEQAAAEVGAASRNTDPHTAPAL